MKIFRWALPTFLFWLLLGCATADRAQLADVASTGYALSNGLVEANPLLENVSWPVAGAIKLGVTQAVKFLPSPYCDGGLVGLTAIGWGAALWNLATAWGSGAASVPFILGLTVWRWDAWSDDATATCMDPWHWTPLFEQGWGDRE